MTTKEFIIIADSIAKIGDKDKREFVLTWFLQDVARTLNPMFNKEKFMKRINASLKTS